MTTITPEGIVVPRYEETLDLLTTLEKQNISPEIDISDNKFLGQFNKGISELSTMMYNLAEIVYYSSSIDDAYGIQLDWIGALKNIPRLSASPTQGTQVFVGDTGTSVPSGVIVQDPVTKTRYYTTSSYTISSLNLVEAIVRANAVTASTSYTVTINSVVYSMTTDVTPTEAEIYLGLKSAIDLDVDSGLTAEIVSDGLKIVVDDYNGTTFSLSSTLDFFSGGIAGYVYGVDDSTESQGVSSVTKIVTPILGLTSTYNPYSFTVGSPRESDEDYRVRLKNPASINGYATLPAITSVVGATPGVSYVKVEENDDVVDGALPAKSIQVVVEGGTDADVAEAIFTSKGASVKTYGDVTIPVLFDGQSHQINFSRPSGVYFAIRIQYERYLEEPLPDDSVVSVKQSVTDFVNDQGIGTDFIPQRLYEAVYGATTGLGKVIIEAQQISTPGETPVGTWSTDTVPIAVDEFAQTTIDDVLVVEL